jgi:hypothetical protein
MKLKIFFFLLCFCFVLLFYCLLSGLLFFVFLYFALFFVCLFFLIILFADLKQWNIDYCNIVLSNMFFPEYRRNTLIKI